jgi:hypothetical protein
MKISITFLNWINRIIMIPFLISLLVSIVDTSYLFYSMYIAFAVGCFQLFSFLITTFFIKNIKSQTRKCLFIYIISVVFYFTTWFTLNYFRLNTSHSILIFLLFMIPVVLSVFWTYILEILNK